MINNLLWFFLHIVSNPIKHNADKCVFIKVGYEFLILVTTDKIFDFVKELRSDVKIPMVFMTYANVVYSYGAERFMIKCRETEMDGIVIPDLPFEEKGEFADAAKKYGIASTHSPTYPTM